MNPAQVINRPELGNLSVGSTADIALFEMLKGKVGYLGTCGGETVGDHIDTAIPHSAGRDARNATALERIVDGIGVDFL